MDSVDDDAMFVDAVVDAPAPVTSAKTEPIKPLLPIIDAEPVLTYNLSTGEAVNADQTYDTVLTFSQDDLMLGLVDLSDETAETVQVFYFTGDPGSTHRFLIQCDHDDLHNAVQLFTQGYAYHKERMQACEQPVPE